MDDVDVGADGDLVGAVVVGLGVGFGVVGLADGDSEVDVDGDGVVVAAIAAEAVLLTRMNPEPTVMISGVRTDRASTAHDLLSDRR